MWMWVRVGICVGHTWHNSIVQHYTYIVTLQHGEPCRCITTPASFLWPIQLRHLFALLPYSLPKQLLCTTTSPHARHRWPMGHVGTVIKQLCSTGNGTDGCEEQYIEKGCPHDEERDGLCGDVGELLEGHVGGHKRHKPGQHGGVAFVKVWVVVDLERDEGTGVRVWMSANTAEAQQTQQKRLQIHTYLASMTVVLPVFGMQDVIVKPCVACHQDPTNPAIETGVAATDNAVHCIVCSDKESHLVWYMDGWALTYALHQNNKMQYARKGTRRAMRDPIQASSGYVLSVSVIVNEVRTTRLGWQRGGIAGW